MRARSLFVCEGATTRTKEGRDYSIIPARATDRLWMVRAACSPSDAELFFPAVISRGTTKEAKEICAGCPVIEQCRRGVDKLEAAQTFPYWHGVWAGETPLERLRHRRSAQAASSPEKPHEGSVYLYVHHRCRCRACREVNSAYKRAGYANRK